MHLDQHLPHNAMAGLVALPPILSRCKRRWYRRRLDNQRRLAIRYQCQILGTICITTQRDLLGRAHHSYFDSDSLLQAPSATHTKCRPHQTLLLPQKKPLRLRDLCRRRRWAKTIPYPRRPISRMGLAPRPTETPPLITQHTTHK